MQIIQDVDVLNTFGTDSDHCLVTANVINRTFERYNKIKQVTVTRTIHKEEMKNNFHEHETNLEHASQNFHLD